MPYPLGSMCTLLGGPTSVSEHGAESGGGGGGGAGNQDWSLGPPSCSLPFWGARVQSSAKLTSFLRNLCWTRPRFSQQEM